MKNKTFLSFVVIIGVFLLSNCNKDPEPKAIINVVSSGKPGDSIIIDASKSDGENLQYKWSVKGPSATYGEGFPSDIPVYNDISISASFIAATNGTYDVNLSITSNGISHAATTPVIISGGFSTITGLGGFSFNNPTKIMATDSFLFISDEGSSKIYKLNFDGNYLKELNFNKLFYIYDSLFYVLSDTNSYCLQSFDFNFKLVNSFIFSTYLPSGDDISGNDKKALITLGGSSEPFLMSLDLEKLSTNSFGNLGTGNLNFKWNGSFCTVYDNGDFFVTDAGNDRVQILDTSFSYKGEFSVKDERQKVLGSPTAIAVNNKFIAITNVNTGSGPIDIYERSSNRYLYHFKLPNCYIKSMTLSNDKLFALISNPYKGIYMFSK